MMSDQVLDNESALAIRNLRFHYERGRHAPAEDAFELAIRRLDLVRGEQLLVRGGSGHGKSTLLQLIAGLIDPIEGEVLIAGTNVFSMRGGTRDRFRGKHVGMVFQTFNLLHGFTAAENVMAALMFSDIPCSSHREHAVALLRRLGLDSPDREPLELSVGQQQRVAVARALACDPVLVLADEPTASLDPQNAAIAIELLREVCREKNAALLIVSHDPMLDEHFTNHVAIESLISDAREHAATHMPDAE